MADEMNGEREAFEAHWLKEGNPRNSLAKWQEADNVPPKSRGAYVMACTRDAWSAFQAGRASLAASAGSEPVAQAKGVFEFWWADHMPNATQAEAWREWCELMRPGPIAFTHPSPPEGAGWKWVPVEPTKAMLLAGSADLRLGDCIGTLTRAAECYRAMIAAAPPASGAKEL